MSRSLTMAALMAAGTLLSCSSARLTDDSRTEDAAGLEAGSGCPLLAASCPAGCYPIGGEPVDVKNACLLAPQKWGCSGVEVGPPYMECTVTPDGTIWVSRDARRHPRGRPCTFEETAAITHPTCS